MFFKSSAALAFALLAAPPALADQRGYSLSGFNRLRIEGPVKVVVTAGASPEVRAQGDRRAIDRIKVESNDGLLMVSIDRSNWTGESDVRDTGRATLYVTAPSIDSVSLIGAGDIALDKVRGARFTLILSGSAHAAIAALRVDRLTVGINGTGEAQLGGQAMQTEIRSQGNGTVDASALTADDAVVTLIGGGDIKLKARRTAKTTLKGSGRIEIIGNPACSGSRDGSGEILCGGAEP